MAILNRFLIIVLPIAHTEIEWKMDKKKNFNKIGKNL